MSSERARPVLLVLLAMIASLGAAAEPSPAPGLVVEPRSCVSLSRGRTCYLDTHIRWRVEGEGRHCLFVVGASEPVHCAAGGHGELVYAFSDSDSQALELRAADGVVVARAEILVSWVYDGNQRRRSWRLF